MLFVVHKSLEEAAAKVCRLLEDEADSAGENYSMFTRQFVYNNILYVAKLKVTPKSETFSYHKVEDEDYPNHGHTKVTND